MNLKKLLRTLAVNRFRSLQWRLVFIFISITLALIIPISILLKLQVQTSYYNTFKEKIDIGFDVLKNKKEYRNYDELYDDLVTRRNAIVYFYMSGPDRTYTIVDRSAKVKYSTDPFFKQQPKGFDMEVSNSENLISVLAGNTNTNRRLNHTTDGRSFFDYAREKGEYIIYFRYYSDEWSEIIEDFNKIIINSAIIAIIASLIIGYILSKTITVPIVSIIHRARQIAAGNFDQTLDVKSNDEIGKLTKTFNHMARELKDNLNEISSEKNKIETILNYMTDGVVAFNTNGEVIHSNPAFKRILGLSGTNWTFNEFSKTFEIGVSLEEILYLELSGSKERNISVSGKYIRVYFALFTDEEQKAGGIIAVLQDITEQQKLENMRKEFVANVSHELRTPLTSIKSYAETLLEGAVEDRETADRFLGVINSEADRMTRLVKDLLQLSKLDNSQMRLDMKTISFVDLVKNCIEKVRIEAKNKKLEIESYVIGDMPDIDADHGRTEQVVLNILSNSIKYTLEGGKITIYIGKLYNDVYVKVTDTGIGIPEQDQSRVFERFYRVDKARSREMGGTGLGLAIAKEIVEAHGGTISMVSEVGKGTEVTVKLPVYSVKNEDDGKCDDDIFE